MRVLKTLLTILALGLPLVACNKTAESTAVTAPKVASYEVKGVIKAFREQNKIVVLNHEAIPNVMEAMTMPFELADVRLAKGFKVGDQVTFTLEVSETTFVVSALKKR